ncbi:WYL domain-containing protein [Nocardioides cavernaquae]|uniref:WYL domain-containing protein n=1 Tax=Nocardioides cavernaquae TaxID=2321396 RepID=A0A3A5H7N7_9ACTN|nr:WYL domain-containing protein [Nocardioides cavernaquae]RJS46462.1 WYL domain-containing protein [Nocardioides cavernaquae]
MATPKYTQRFARLPAVFEQLASHPGGLPLADLAAQTGVPTAELREDILAFYTADVAPLLLGLTRPAVLDFRNADGAEDEPTTAEYVCIIDERPSEELGVEYVDPAELALIFTAAQALLDIDPSDADLLGAVEVLTETAFGTPVEPSGTRSWNRALEALQEAVAGSHLVEISYSRSWDEGVFTRTIEPYLLVQTQRGWEVDAGPADAHGRIRTYLLSNIRDYVVSEATFKPPADLARMLAAQRKTETVRVRIPHHARWAADFYAEDVAIVDDDESTATLDLELLQPVDTRVGLLLLIAGDESWVLNPAHLATAGPILAGELLTHHLES